MKKWSTFVLATIGGMFLGVGTARVALAKDFEELKFAVVLVVASLWIGMLIGVVYSYFQMQELAKLIEDLEETEQ